jgi:hypothetical protein
MIANEQTSQSDIQRIRDITASRIGENCSRLDRARALECIAEANDAADEDIRAIINLTAQRNISAWTIVVGLVGVLSGPLTIAGMYFLWKNLYEVRRATEISEKAVGVAREANDIEQRIGKATVRAYVSISDAMIQFPGGKSDTFAFLQLKCRNSGQSPAFNILFDVNLLFVAQSKSFTCSSLRFIVGSMSSGWEGSADTKILQSAVPESLALLFGAGNLSVMVNGTVKWTDVFGDTESLVLASEIGVIGANYGAPFHVSVKAIQIKPSISSGNS